MRQEVLRRSRLDSVTDWEARAEPAGYRASVLANRCGVSERHLRRFLRLKFGKPPREWLAQVRLARAVASLQQTLLVKEAAFQAGFKDPAHFTRSFKQQYGVSPSAFRHANAA
jgi:AraC-like DNA-binding protein